MKGAIQGIVEILEEEYGFYQDLLELSRKKVDVLLTEQVDELEKILGVEQSIIMHIGLLEKNRNECLMRFAREKGIKAEELTFSTLLSFASGDTKKRLQQVWGKLEETIAKQKLLNEQNSQLIKSKLEFIDFTLSLLTGRDEAGSTYAKGGQKGSAGQGRNLFDKTV